MATLSQPRFLFPGRPRFGAGRPAASNRSLTVASDGAALLRNLKDRSDVSRNAWLRIVIDPHHRSLSMSLALRSPDDLVVIAHGTKVFLSVAAAKRLRGCTLRAGDAASGSTFYLDRSLSARSVQS